MSGVTAATIAAVVGAVAAVGGAAYGAISSAEQADAQKKAADYNAQVARQNAEIAKQQGIAQAQAQDRQARVKMGAMKANMAASGVDPGVGSPLDVLADSARMSKLDNLTILWNAQAKAAGYGNNANLDDMLAASAQSKADSATTAGIINGIGAVAGGASKVYGSYVGGTETTSSYSGGYGAGNALPDSLYSRAITPNFESGVY